MDVFESMKSIDKTSANAEVEGILHSLTDMQTPKKGTKRYFHGHLSDGSKKMRLVGFSIRNYFKISRLTIVQLRSVSVKYKDQHTAVI